MELLLEELNKRGVKLRLDGDDLRIAAPQGAVDAALRDALRQNKAQLMALLRGRRDEEAPLPQIVPDLAALHEPFPLTPIQHAYWMGRGSAMEMGNVATHLYVELDCDNLDVTRLSDALNRLIERHPMLRAVVGSDGQQRILPQVPRYTVALSDQALATPQAAEQAAEATREILSHQVLKPDQWPLFDIRATRLPAQRLRLHVSLDLLILDAWSIFLFFREWSQLYEEPATQLAPQQISFRDYVLAEQQLHDSEAYRRAERYWMDRVDSLPPAPELPLRSDPAARQAPRFSRRQSMLDKARWTRLKAAAQAQDLTPSGLLMALYAEVLARWSSSPHFTLNVTISNRLPMHADVPQLIGDFTSLLLQEVDGRPRDRTFLAFAQGLQKQFATDLDNRLYSGMHVMREWAKRRGIQRKAVMPVVFSSGLVRATDANDPGSLDQLGSKVFSVSQTSQVWLDHHVMEQQGDLVFIWDAADAVFEEGVLDAMFSAYCDSIRRLADDLQLWLQPHVLALPAEMQARRLSVEDSGHALPTRCLHAGLVEQARLRPDAAALVAGGRCLSYAQLLSESAAVADVLMQRGIRPGEPVAVLMRKGWEQIVAVYGVLLAGGAYMPIDADLPVKRQSDLLRIGEVRQLLVQPDSLREGVELGDALAHRIRPGVQGLFGAAHEASLQAPLDQLAYTIYTSGTTGVPKGVMIDHRGAMNTIAHMNRLFGVQAADKALGVSSLSFDLSVYDIFGLHAAGGTLVLPEAQKGHDAQHWRDLVQQHGITLWNSAPQLMRMLMDTYMDSHVPGEASALPLNTVLLSGDFIPLDLPDRIRHRSPAAKVISLGGATEASIWSIYYPIDQVSPAWASIPYGKPLPNQSVRVYDKSWQLCPDQVKGKIYIGGTGLAMGYWRDAEKTAARFVTHPESGERLYDTGDLGRYAADGNVIIMGRDDSQIKIRGHRIELGEIEAVLRRHPAVRAALVVAVGEPPERRQLAAYVEPNSESGDSGAAIDAAALQAFVGERLPDYMVPRHVLLLERLPTSSNGKIDTSALPPVDDAAHGSGAGPVQPRTPTEKTVLDIWLRVMGLPLGVTDNFFELGGDSVMATQMVRELSAVFPVALEMHELFENLTVEGVAALYDHKLAALADGTAAPAEAMPAQTAERAMADPAAVQADLQAVLAKLATLDFDAPLPADVSAPRAVLVTGATGWIGGHAVGALLAQTQARIVCLVRGSDAATARMRLLSHLHELDIAGTPALAERIEVICGDLAQPMLGLDSAQWTRLLAELDAVYHFGASLNVTSDYATHSATNVHSLEWLVRLSAEHHRKPLVAMSPMTICRRHIDGQLVVYGGETGHDHPRGLLTTYAQSKWAAEQLLLAAAERGLPVRIYRSSHALPSARTGIAKANDTYNTVLKVACQVGAIPDWTDSRLPGLPVDLLCRLLVDDATSPGLPSGIAHLENLDPMHFKDLLGVLLATRGDAVPSVPELLPHDAWKARCAAVTEGLSDREEALVKLLFGKRSVGAGVDNIFSNHGFETRHFEQRGWAPKLAGLTPASYWHTVCRRNGW